MMGVVCNARPGRTCWGCGRRGAVRRLGEALRNREPSSESEHDRNAPKTLVGLGPGLHTLAIPGSQRRRQSADAGHHDDDPAPCASASVWYGRGRDRQRQPSRVCLGQRAIWQPALSRCEMAQHVAVSGVIDGHVLSRPCLPPVLSRYLFLL